MGSAQLLQVRYPQRWERGLDLDFRTCLKGLNCLNCLNYLHLLTLCLGSDLDNIKKGTNGVLHSASKCRSQTRKGVCLLGNDGRQTADQLLVIKMLAFLDFRWGVNLLRQQQN